MMNPTLYIVCTVESVIVVPANVMFVLNVDLIKVYICFYFFSEFLSGSHSAENCFIFGYILFGSIQSHFNIISTVV